MFRAVPGIATVVFACAACSPAAESATPAPIARSAAKHEIAAAQIAHDLIGRMVKISDVAGRGPPDEWTFEAEEFKQADILESQRAGNELTLVVYMMTRNNPKPDERSVQVSGKLRLLYALKSGKWMLNTIENLTFRYSIAIAA